MQDRDAQLSRHGCRCERRGKSKRPSICSCQDRLFALGQPRELELRWLCMTRGVWRVRRCYWDRTEDFDRVLRRKESWSFLWLGWRRMSRKRVENSQGRSEGRERSIIEQIVNLVTTRTTRRCSRCSLYWSGETRDPLERVPVGLCVGLAEWILVLNEVGRS